MQDGVSGIINASCRCGRTYYQDESGGLIPHYRINGRREVNVTEQYKPVLRLSFVSIDYGG